MMRFGVRGLICFLWVASCLGQGKPLPESAYARGLREYQAGQFAPAEKDFREVTNADTFNIFAEFYLGQSLFMQKKYAESVGPYEKARELEASGKKLSSDQHRILVDQLVIAYGVSGNFKKVHDLLEDAIRHDPEYPLNYYNLACAFAEEGEKAKMLANLSTAYQHRDHVLKGEQMPDPRSDDSFQKYVHDDDFIRLMKLLGYN
jgi:tetratricopeptide (TPR) repeat protein